MIRRTLHRLLRGHWPHEWSELLADGTVTHHPCWPCWLAERKAAR